MAHRIEAEMLELGKLMAKFQMIEFILKAFITRANFKISKSEGKENPEHGFSELEKSTLGKFLRDNEKSKLISNNQTIERLKLLKPYRDYIAHKAFLVLSNIPNKETFLGFENNPLDYPVLNTELDDLIQVLTSEYRAV